MTSEENFFSLTSELSEDEIATLIATLGSQATHSVNHDWQSWRHDGQGTPAGEWRTWVIMAGRGYGKTRAGAEWVAAQARQQGDLRIALVAATLEEAARIMVEGKSGLLAVARPWISDWLPHRRLLRFSNGAEATLFSGTSPEALRGPEHHIAWCDELAKWEKPVATWDMLQLGMRLGEQPRVAVTTTPRSGPSLTRIMAANHTVISGGKMRKNPHLPKAFMENVEELYAGTRLGRQELDGELLPDVAGALWSVELIERCRVNCNNSTNLQNPFASSEDERPRRRAIRMGVSSSLDTNGDGEARVSYVRTVIGVDPPARPRRHLRDHCLRHRRRRYRLCPCRPQRQRVQPRTLGKRGRGRRRSSRRADGGCRDQPGRNDGRGGIARG